MERRLQRGGYGTARGFTASELTVNGLYASVVTPPEDSGQDVEITVYSFIGPNGSLAQFTKDAANANAEMQKLCIKIVEEFRKANIRFEIGHEGIQFMPAAPRTAYPDATDYLPICIEQMIWLDDPADTRKAKRCLMRLGIIVE